MESQLAPHSLTHTHFSVLYLSFSFLFRVLPFNLYTSHGENEKNQFREVVSRSHQSSRCAMHDGGGDNGGGNQRPRTRIHFAFISFLVSIHDVFISLNQNAQDHEKKTSSCRVISLTFRRSIDDEKKIITLFLSSLACLLAGCFSHLHI